MSNRKIYIGEPVHTYVLMKVQKTLSLPLEVAEELDDEDNQSALVAELLSDHYDLNE